MKGPVAAALLLGAATVLGFAPFGIYPLPLVTLALLFHLWRKCDHGPMAALLGFAWGLGFFLTGVSWVYVSLHDVGGMALPLAALATLLFCAYLALFPALAGYAFRRWLAGGITAQALLAAGAWTLADWLRSWLLTGFPWLAVGYSQGPPSPLASYAPIIGVFGVEFLAVLAAALLAFGWKRFWPAAAVVAVIGAGFGLRGLGWTEPVGEPLTVALLQGNIPQSLKWEPEHLPLSIDTYTRLAAKHPAKLTVLPETAIPLMFDDIPRDVLRDLTRNGDLLLGSAARVRRNGEIDGYSNSAVALTPSFEAEGYAKTHLVPFGEFIPPGFGWFFALVNIPMSDFTAGPPGQKPLEIAGQRIMPNICYEDLFGDQILAGLPTATLLVNLSNTAWFGDSLAQPQHLQIAQMRALETGRPWLSATNTGMTAALAPDGTVSAVLAPFTADALTVSVRGYQGLTPFAQAGNLPALLLACLACLPAWRAHRRLRRS
ncbi:MAG TPA: apolipoprotein N-acyltransferase [Rhodocyclaceae bacterium]|nr:apolipoprotein N-acyltransferase [Rhodocyclaceae bacterium]